jgi:hypothetical protein
VPHTAPGRTHLNSLNNRKENRLWFWPVKPPQAPLATLEQVNQTISWGH